MKRIKILAIVLAVAMVMTGAAYAYWTDATFVKGTVETGNLKMVVQNDDLHPRFTYASKYVVAQNDAEGEDSYIRAVVNEKKGYEDTVEFKVSNLYPSAKFRMDFEVKNEGTIPVKLYDVAINRNSGSSKLYDALQYRGDYCIDTGDGFGDLEYFSDGNRFVNFKDHFEADVEEALEGVVLEPGDIIRFGAPDGDGGEDSGSIAFRVPAGANPEDPEVEDDLPGNDNSYMDLDCGITITFNWVQAVNGNPADPVEQ